MTTRAADDGPSDRRLEVAAWTKAELHSHLDGAVRPATALALARELGLDVQLWSAMEAPDDCASLAEFISHFAPALAVLQSEASLERAARELGEDSAAENIDYLEVRWAPRLHMRAGLGVSQVIQAVMRGLAEAPLHAVAIVCAMRDDSPEDNVELARVAGDYAGRGVVGFDLAGDEAAYPAAPHRPAFEAARAAGLHITCHAGETSTPGRVEEALQLGVERLGHGVTAAGDQDLVARLKREGTVLDLCPTANWKCKAVPGIDRHPLPALVRSGIRCTISTDSRTVAGTTLTREYELAATMLGMTAAELQACNRTAYEAAFDR